MSDLQTLLSMGFSKERAEEALIETNYAGIDVALEWLLVTDGITTNEEEGNDSTAEKALLEEHFEDFGIKENETETTCEIEEATNSREILVNSDNKTRIETRILVRLLNGKTLSKVFTSQDNLDAVVFWIQTEMNTNEFGLMTNFPKKVFTDEDYKQSLAILNLVPSAVLIVTQLEKWENLKVCYGTKNDDESRKAEEKKRKEEVEQQFKKMEEERLALERVRCQIEDDKAARKQRWPHLYQPSENQLQSNQPQALLPRPNPNLDKNHKKIN